MKSTYIGIGVVVVILGILFFTLQKTDKNKADPLAGLSRTVLGVSTTTETTNTEITKSNITQNNNMEVTELKIEDEVVGTGAEAKAGNTVTVQYVGQLTNGQIFDASRNHGDQGFSFTLGAGQVIQGWDMGVAGMKVGGKRKLYIPSNLAYGNQDVGGGLIPANSALIFEVELVSVK